MMSAITLTFSDPGEFAAASRAVNLLEAAGFSIGRPQRGAPRGILFGLYDIQKWRNLNKEHRRALHGVMRGDMRFGPVTVEIFASAPDAAKAAIGRVMPFKAYLSDLGPIEERRLPLEAIAPPRAVVMASLSRDEA